MPRGRGLGPGSRGGQASWVHTQPDPRAQRLDSRPALQGHRLAKCLLRETPPTNRSLGVMGRCLACGEVGPGAGHLRGVDVPLARLRRPRAHIRRADGGSSWAPRAAEHSAVRSGLSSGDRVLLISPQLLDRRVPHTHTITSLYGRPESPPRRWHLDHKPVWFQYKIQKRSYSCI